MNIWNILSQSLESLSTNRLRSLLTMLGVVWGTASVVFLLGFGKGFVSVMRAEARSGSDGYVVFWPKRALSEVSGRKGARQLSFELKEVDVILNHCPSVRYVTPADHVYTLMKHENRLKMGGVFGVMPDAFHIYNLSLEQGRFVQPSDIDNMARVIVLGADLKEALFPGGMQAIGQHVKILGISFEVIGTLAKKGEQLITMQSEDDVKAYVPVTYALRYLGTRKIGEIDVQPGNPSVSKECISEVKAALAKELDFSPDDEEALEIFDLSSMILSLDIMALALAVFVTFVGVITLFVGAVGVMNIMLISVTERTREIGIRKALGAKRRQILMQFMAEALAITALSGIVGIVIGCAVSLGIAAMPRPKIFAAPEISVFTLAVSFLVMVGVGLFAGIAPALRAANMEPVESLRYE
ncbi:MAG: FtsX-like permease family protein [Candidatus Abyssobacteria bacterium SURF_17]|jgi:putative ABC transport system permease protein|uniref:FtsX-like permease family protein n=1 Tax=Candidatus Abyssobacteria bacterium SURF_17 TaxID=2093361 RepID=A0A419F0I7_9BACT|nr:MAG: FtsX-like permease family protein [Candidatus Abyssubacteria bacterium SURF_17]